MSTRDESLTVRLSEEELGSLDKLASKWGLSFGGAVRKLVTEASTSKQPDLLTFYGLNGQKVSQYAINHESDFVVDTIGDSLPMQIGRVEFRRARP